MAKKVDKKNLGLGIRALLTHIDEEVALDQEKVVKELAHSVAMISLEEIEVNPFQPRNEFDQEALDELADSIRVHGLIQPLTVRRLAHNAYQLISGERRLRASRMAGLTEIPAYIRIANDQEMLEMALIENIQRENLNAIEIAITYQRLKEECQLTDENLADRVGKKRPTITNHLRLLKLPPDIQSAIKEKKLSMGHARALTGIEDYALRDSLFRQTLKEELSVRALENLIAAYNQPKPKKKTEQLPDDFDQVQQQFRSFFGTKKVTLKLQGQGKGQIQIAFHSVQELNELLDRIDP
ncbi:MAG: ParB/RepB/Spo0J family partition protein [Haliscomenobacter sp.]|nr:ParB/RepB/Spo0J family partition protein [Haliscomenobacter sp.]MBP9873760.1 ParB/RepB/Spo0J family partition protein [Haliscomenobacter sp.]